MTDPVGRLRALCLALPAVVEKVSHGSPTWFVAPGRTGRVFVTLADHHHGDGHLAFWCAAPPGAQEELVAAEPERFFRPPYVGGRGWIGVRLDVGEADPDTIDPAETDQDGTDQDGTDRDGTDQDGTDWDEIAEIVTDAYRHVAPKKLAALLP